MIFTREEFETRTNWKMSYEDYCKCYCPNCYRKECKHRNAYRRLPEIDDGLALCPNLSNGHKFKLKVYSVHGINKGMLNHEEYFGTIEELDERYKNIFKYELFGLNPTAWEFKDNKWERLAGY